ncbi:hypothetical protein GUITHDRAFT_149799 [Guillardia theta CCMP2712]|uniref:Uncharacterized protein n=1 Tax=Guillardia theta (strain CCMP2712) TaxID=905079 RepID=L1K513_GUITC|nr:hypothetical protein GUITHDRAFT_149799 [Guillardia theta CCMP2712]EKX55448.1 hypothetical protein GUITHDRAFT_149799 [Guillardia theta CCMP2712]|eukprot:XP_005842428.1 hypothetical protein GUITHDRAFT_149799 [Guillardia theta CCMP2712]
MFDNARKFIELKDSFGQNSLILQSLSSQACDLVDGAMPGWMPTWTPTDEEKNCDIPKDAFYCQVYKQHPANTNTPGIIPSC